MTFCGLTSRCTTPRSWAWASASVSASPIRSDVAVRERAVRLELRERAALDELGDEVAAAVLLARVEQRDDPLVVEPRDRAGLALRALRRDAVGRDDLDRDRAARAARRAPRRRCRSRRRRAARPGGSGPSPARGRRPPAALPWPSPGPPSTRARRTLPAASPGCTGRNTPPGLISSEHVTRLRDERAAIQENTFVLLRRGRRATHTSPAAARRRRRARPQTADHQTLLVRRAVFGGGDPARPRPARHRRPRLPAVGQGERAARLQQRRRRARPRLGPAGVRAALRPAAQPDPGRRPLQPDQRLPRHRPTSSTSRRRGSRRRTR